MNFANAVKNNTNIKYTENGAVAYSTTGKALIDLFAQIGALRPRTEREISEKYAAAFAADPLLATKMLFYAGNIRGGLGERRTFRICLKWLARNQADIVIKNIGLIPYFNRWDSLFVLIDTPAEKEMWKVIYDQLCEDMANARKSIQNGKKESISLLAKWMPSETASSAETRKLAHKCMTNLGLTPRTYRKMLTALRKHLRVVEASMSAKEWEAIQYAQVPSYAMKNYRKAFAKHDPEGFTAYKNSLVKGEAKINASTLFPYDLVAQYTHKYGYWGNSFPVDDIVEAQWKALPNYVQGENNILIMADVSGSMSGRPMETSIGLATYFAQRATSFYHNLYLTFTDEPHFVELREGATLAECVAKVASTDVGYSTNLHKAFRLILKTAVDNKVAPEEMPKALVVISDMEIDYYFRYPSKLDFVETVKAEFKKFNYQCPKLVMWNVQARNDTFLSKNEDVLFVSGQSPSVFRELCTNLDGKTSWDLMIETLSNKMYDCIKI